MRARWVAIGLGVAAGSAALVERQLIRRERARVEPVGEADFVPPVTERTIETDDGAEIHVLERGQGQPIVLLHGITLAARVWGYQLHDLSATHRVVAIDQRGHGRSRPGREPADLARLGSDLLAVLEALDLRRARSRPAPTRSGCGAAPARRAYSPSWGVSTTGVERPATSLAISSA